MRKNNHVANMTDGFMALIAVMVLATGTLAFSLVTMSAAAAYADAVLARELRIQARLNAVACLDGATLMLAKDFFMDGTTTMPEFGCVMSVKNTGSDTVGIDVVSVLSRVRSYGHEEIILTGDSVKVTTYEVK